jgi:hypothetical protein
MPKPIRLALRPLALMLVAFVAALVLAPAPAAHAQASQAVASPLTTKRLERLLKVYVAPTDEEAASSRCGPIGCMPPQSLALRSARMIRRARPTGSPAPHFPPGPS